MQLIDEMDEEGKKVYFQIYKWKFPSKKLAGRKIVGIISDIKLIQFFFDSFQLTMIWTIDSLY